MPLQIPFSGWLEKLVDSTKKHFDAEEQSMQLAGFGGLAEHRARHQDLLFEIDMLVDKIRSGERTVSDASLSIYGTTGCSAIFRAWTPCMDPS